MSENKQDKNVPEPKSNESVKEKKEVKHVKKKKTTKIINMLILVGVAIGLFFVVKSYFNIGNDHYTNSSQVESFINPVNTRVSAYIKEIRFVEHQYVKKGDTLMVLDDREIQTQLGQAEACIYVGNGIEECSGQFCKNGRKQC